MVDEHLVVRRPLPLDFVLERTGLTRDDVTVGLFRHLLLPDDLSTLIDRGWLPVGTRAEELVSEFTSTLPSDWATTGLNPAEFPRRATPALQTADRKWLYLQLDWLWTHRTESEDPLGEVELTYADFGYPEEVADLVRYMPAKQGRPRGEAALIDNWGAYLRASREEFRKKE